MGRAGDPHGVAGAGVVAALAVEVDAGIVGRQQHDLDAAVIGQRDRPGRERVGAHGHQRDAFDAGVEDRPVGRQRVGRRAGGRRDDHAVGALGVDELAVDAQVEFDHPAQLALVDHHVVEGHRVEHPLSAAQHLGIEQDAGFFSVAPLEDLADLVEGDLAGDVGEKAQPALIDARQRHVVRSEPAGAVEQGAVTAEHHGQIGPGADLVVACDRETRREPRGTRGSLLDQHGNAEAAQIIGQPKHRLGHFRALFLSFRS